MKDEMIMEAVKRGDLQQGSLLFERYHGRIYNFLSRMTADRETAMDLTQNVFFRMIKYRASYNGDRFDSWIFKIARNVFSDHYRTNKVHKAAFTCDEKISDQADNIGDEQGERERLLYLSLEKLSPDQRELLILTRFQRMKYEEVAGIMDTTVSNIKIKVHRAIQKLREVYFELERTEF